MEISEIKIKAQRLIEKGKKLGDQDLINIGLDLLDTIPEVNEMIVVTPETIAAIPQFELKPREEENFRADNKKKRKRTVMGDPNKKNAFFDNKTEFMDITTPVLESITQRRPPMKLIEQRCSICGRSQQVHPAFAADGTCRSTYYCDACLSKK